MCARLRSDIEAHDSDIEAYDASFSSLVERLELIPQFDAAIAKHPERVSSSIPSRARDHGMDDTSSSESDSEADEMDTNHFKLRNAVATANGGGRPRALTRGNAKFAASFAAKLLRERGYATRPDDALEVLEWLMADPFDVPSEELWRRLGQVH